MLIRVVMRLAFYFFPCVSVAEICSSSLKERDYGDQSQSGDGFAKMVDFHVRHGAPAVAWPHHKAESLNLTLRAMGRDCGGHRPPSRPMGEVEYGRVAETIAAIPALRTEPRGW